MIREQVFVNQGEVYKEVRVFEGPITDSYVGDMEADPIATFYQNTPNGQKHYRSSFEFRKWLLDYETGSSLEDYDKCPDVTLWCGEAFFPNGYGETELYFKVDDTAMLHSVAEYYNLPYPITSETEKLFNTPEVISSYTGLDGTYLILGSVKFMNNEPTLLKLYTVYKYLGRWDLFNKGRVFSEGQVIEEGGMYYIPNEVRYMSTSGGNIVTEYVEAKNDPIAQWEAHRTTLDTNETKIEHYESSKAVRLGVGNLNTGSNYEEYDRAPSVNTWLGRSWIEDEHEELYFLVENREMLDEVASYYDLPVPYDDELKVVLDNNIESIRFKSYDLNNEGEGNFVAVVVASVTFEDDKATMLKLYETTRWNE